MQTRLSSKLVVGVLTVLFVVSALSPLAAPVGAVTSIVVKQFVPNPDYGTYTCSSTSPCPMGVTDYGVNGKSTYSYKAVEWNTWSNFTKLTIAGNHQMTIQQNTVDYGVYETGKGPAKSGVYWIQDVPYITQSGKSYTIQLLDNIWNMSSTTAEMGGKIFGNLESDCSQTGGQPQFYYCVGKQVFKTTLPFEIQMLAFTEVLPSGGHAGSSAVFFAIAVYHSGTLVGSATFDEVAFNGAATGGAQPWFQVGGTNPYGLPNDAETVQCGPGGGSSQVITKVAATMSEFYVPVGGGAFSPVPHAWSAGSDTAETVSGVLMKHGTTGSGFNDGVAKTGADNNVQLW